MMKAYTDQWWAGGPAADLWHGLPATEEVQAWNLIIPPDG